MLSPGNLLGLGVGVVGETDLGVPGDSTQYVFLHLLTVSLNLKEGREMRGQRNGHGKIYHIPPIHQSQPNFLYLSVENTSSAGILLSAFTPLVPSIICTALKASPQPQSQCPYIDKRRLGGTEYLSHI